MDKTPSEAEESNAAYQGVLWMFGTLFSFALMAIAIRELKTDYSAFEILLYRSLIGALMVGGYIFYSGKPELLRSSGWAVQGLRHTVHFAAQALWIVGIFLLPLAHVFAFEFTSPIWATILAVFFFKERLSRHRMVAVVAGFAGVMVILRPGFLPIETGAVLVLLAAFGFGLTNILTKWITRKDHVATLLFYMSLVQFLLALVIVLYSGTPNLQMITKTHLFWLVATGLLGLTAHLCLAKALSVADAIVVLPFDYLRLPLIALAGFVFYGEPLEIWVFIGGAIIFAGVYQNIWFENKKRKIN